MEPNDQDGKVTMTQEGWEAVNAERLERMFAAITKALAEHRLVKIEHENSSRLLKSTKDDVGVRSAEFARDVVMTFTVDTGDRELIEANSPEELERAIQKRRV